MNTQKTGDQAGVGAAVRNAAILAAQLAWNAGENVERALTLAGYVRPVVEYATEYVRNEAEKMSKRGRSESGTFVFGAPSRYTAVSKPVRKYVKETIARLQEDKYFRASIADSAVSATGVTFFGPTVGVVQGTTDITRIGNNIRVKNLWFKGWFGDTVSNIGRLVVVWDRAPNGATATWLEIMDNTSTNSPYNHDTVVGCGGQRFTVLHDTRYNVIPKFSGATQTELISYDKKCDKVVTYDGVAGTAADLVTNNIVFAAISNGATLDLALQVEICFTDA